MSPATTLCALAIAGVFLHFAPAQARAADAMTSGAWDCALRAGALRERLEAVTEAVIDGRAAAVPAAAESAQAWWRLHGATFAGHADAASQISQLVNAARSRHALEAAHLSVQLSAETLGWCPGELSIADRLMVADLVGMAAWLRARGVATAEPGNSRAVMDSIGAALLRAHHAGLAARLHAAYAAVHPLRRMTGGKPSDARAAVGLLGLVDEIEKVLH